MIFPNRQHAGHLLAERLASFKDTDALILALPRGGVPVAREIADVLQVPLDVVISRKIGAPFHREVAVGAICESDPPVWNEKLLSELGMSPDDLDYLVAAEVRKVARQKELFRDHRPFPTVANKTVIIVDDGLATGTTMTAAIAFVKSMNPARIVVAVPVAAKSSARKIRQQVDEVISLVEREDLNSVGQWYSDFSQVSDREVVKLLENNSREVEISMGHAVFKGDLTIFPAMKAVIIFAHGSGSGRKSPRNQQVAKNLNDAGFGTLLFDLLTEDEATVREHTFDVELLSRRLVSATQWIRQQPETKDMKLGYFGAGTGAAAAICAASKLSGPNVYAIVSRGGRPDLASVALSAINAPTLLIVGSKDSDVIDLNRRALSQLNRAKMYIVAGASHLFEEPGALEEVSEQAAEWFDEQLENQSRHTSFERRPTLDEAIENAMIEVKGEHDFDPLIDALKDTRVVMLGESTHGTEEFYRIRSYLSQRLIANHGFKFIAVEGDWPDASRLNKYIKTGEGGSAIKVLKNNHRWPTWMWANEQIANLAEWMRTSDAAFYGLDIYSLFESIEEVIDYLKKTDMKLAQEFQRRYACFEPFNGNEISYARSLLQYPRGCEQEALENLKRLVELRLNNEDDLFSSQQNARIVANAEGYYRAVLEGDSTSWNLRDGHMMETLDHLLKRAGEGAKAIVWAHNTHIGDYRATDMKEAGYVNLGGLARQNYGAENVALVGFSTYQGDVLAGSAWGRPEQVMNLPSARRESYEHHFHKAAEKYVLNQFYLFLEDKATTPFAEIRGHRAIGVVYDPVHERRANYVPTQLSKRYDAMIFIDQTHCLKSLHAPAARNIFPETWPSGQ